MLVFRKMLIVMMSAVLIFVPCVSYSQDDLLDNDDVRHIMDQLFDYHVNKKQISPLIIKRSLKIYIDQFDGNMSYLLADEVDPYLNPDRALLQHMYDAYNEDDLSYYQQIYSMVQKSILRVRLIRQKLRLEKDTLFEEAQDCQGDGYPTEFAADVTEIKGRIREQILAFINIQIDKFDGKELSEKDKGKVLNLFDKRSRGYEDTYLNQKEGSQHFFIVTVLKALAKSLDSHTAYFSAEEAYEMKARLEKGLLGIGVVLSEEIDGVKIVRLIENGPAEQSRLIKQGDIIVEIDNKSVVNNTFNEVLNLIRGKEGTKVEFGLVRDNDEFISVALRREQIEIEEDRVDVSKEFFGDGVIGKIALHSFYENGDGISSEKDVSDALLELQRNDVDLKGIVLDMRDNRGGFLVQAVRVAGLFISNGMVVVSKYSDNTMKYFRDIDGYKYFDGPIVVLTSKASASAAEIVAQSLQDYGVAIIVGDERTYGKGSIQHQTITSSNSDNAFFKVTVGRYYTVSGKSTQITGVEADIVVPSLLNDEDIGEEFLEYPLLADSIPSKYEENFSDIDEEALVWFKKYYEPTLQKKNLFWTKRLPVLQKNSGQRIANSERYQQFLGDDYYEAEDGAEFDFEDVQMTEAVNVLKDMIQLKSQECFEAFNDSVITSKDRRKE